VYIEHPHGHPLSAFPTRICAILLLNIAGGDYRDFLEAYHWYFFLPSNMRVKLSMKSSAA